MPRRMSLRLVLLTALITLTGLSGCANERKPHELTPGGLPWNGDVETGDLSQFKDTPWNVAGGALPPVVVSDPAVVRAGKYAVAMTIPGSFRGGGICCGTRSELEPNIREIHSGDDLYFSFSTMLGEGFPVNASWQTITQWKNNFDGSPPLGLDVEEGNYKVSGGASHPYGAEPFRKTIGPAVTSQWVDWVFHIKFSPDPDIGYFEVWQGDKLVLPRFKPASGTMYPNPAGVPMSYLKTGYYRDRDISAPGTIYFDNWKVGTSRGFVDYSSHWPDHRVVS
jgi:Polysaccharide lyase